MDGDGYPIGLDCDDSNPEVNPGATEVPCDGIDNDCDDVSPCHPCSQGEAVDVGALGPGSYEWIGSLSNDDQVYGINGTYLFDVYRIVASTSGLYTFDLESAEFDAYLEMYNATCDLASSNDDGGTGSNANLGLFVFEGDILHIVTSSAESLETGGYTLSLFAIGA